MSVLLLISNGTHRHAESGIDKKKVTEMPCLRACHNGLRKLKPPNPSEITRDIHGTDCGSDDDQLRGCQPG